MQVNRDIRHKIPKIGNSTIAHYSSYMQTINLYWHIQTLMGRVLTACTNTQQEIMIYMAKLMDKVDQLNKKVFVLAQKLANFDFSSSDDDNDPQPPVPVDSPIG